jgi:hypothetical protein
MSEEKPAVAPVYYQTITSTNQSGGITAGTVNVGSQPRVLDDDAKMPLLKGVPKIKPVQVTAVLGDGEAMSFATAIMNFLKVNGYTVYGINQAVYTTIVSGTIITLEADQTQIVVGHHTS